MRGNKHSFATVAVMGTLLGFVIGCGGSDTPNRQAQTTVSDTKSPPTVAQTSPPKDNDKTENNDKQPKSEVVIQYVKLADLEALIEKQKGKVLVLDFWFRGCVPCEEGMPHLAKMRKDHAKDGLEVITVDIDPENRRSGAAKWLKDNNIQLTNLIIADGEEEDGFIEKFELGIFPKTFIYDRDGKEVKVFEGGKPEEIEQVVMDLLKK
ncbi:MAG: TlpA family protein disulfide reductase [Gemmataceae bacterium]